MSKHSRAYSLLTFLFLIGLSCTGAQARAATSDVICGEAVLASEGSHVPTRAMYLPDRLQYLQHTMRTLMQSGGLEFVALGDSIIGNTFGPQYSGVGPKLMGGSEGTNPIAAYYNATIWAGVSILGSTGAWYYEVPPAVQNYVLVYQPDVVIIGGISNHGDIAAIQSVIDQIWAVQPQTEIVLMTGAVDLQAVPTSANLDLDQALPTSYEYQLRALAEQVGAGFIDMRDSWNQYILEVNAENPAIDQSYFQADPIHANSIGVGVLHELTQMFFRPALPCADRAAPRVATPDPPALSPQNLAHGLGTVAAITGADVNGDGHLQVAVFGATSPGTLLPATPAGSPVTLGDTPLSSPIFADLDQVGSLDLLGIDPTGAVRIVFGGAAGAAFPSASQSITLAGVSQVSSIAVLDANHDGRNDILVAFNGGASLRLFLNEGGAQPFTNPTIIDLPVPGVGESTLQLQSADVDGDGLPDIVELRSGMAPGNTRVAVRINSGSAANPFPLSSTYELPLVNLVPSVMTLGDVDGDGKVDLVLGTPASDSRIWLFRNTGRLGTWFFDPLPLTKSAPGTCTMALQIADVNGDGRPDIVAANGCNGTSGGVDVYDNSGAANDFETMQPAAFTTGLTNTSLALADLHSSGVSDVVVGGGDSNGAGAVVELSSYAATAPAQSSSGSGSSPTPPPTSTPPTTGASDPPPAAAATPSKGGGAFRPEELLIGVLLLSLQVRSRRRRPPSAR